MDNQPRKITLISRKTKKRRTIHLVTLSKKKSFKSASANCKQWVIKNGFPIVFKVSYGDYKTKHGKEVINEMDCYGITELKYALQAFVKEYFDEITN